MDPARYLVTQLVNQKMFTNMDTFEYGYDFHQDSYNDLHQDSYNDLHQDSYNDLHQDSYNDLHQDSYNDLHQDSYNGNYEINSDLQFQEEHFMEQDISDYTNNEVINSFSELAECPSETGDWYSVTHSDINDINRELQVLNSGEYTSQTSPHKRSLGLVEKYARRRGQYVEFPWVDEECEEQGWVSVWLYTRPIIGRNDRQTSRRHWAIVFQWQGKTATYEGMPVDGYLQPQWHEGTPIDVEDFTQNNGWIVGNYLGEHYLSPKEVNEAAKYNRANRYKYLAGHTNCHYWAKMFAESLGIEVPHICAEAEPLTALVASVYKSTS